MNIIMPKPTVYFPLDIEVSEEVRLRTIEFYKRLHTGDDEALYYIVKQGVCQTARDKDNYLTPLLSCAWYKLVKTGVECIKQGADMEARSPLGSTALSLAVAYNSQEFTRFLVKRGANVRVYANDASLPVYYDVEQKGYYDIKSGMATYDNFANGLFIPASKEDIYTLLAFNSLHSTDTRQWVDYVGNLGKIVNHVKWQDMENGEEILSTILSGMVEDGVINNTHVERIQQSRSYNAQILRLESVKDLTGLSKS